MQRLLRQGNKSNYEIFNIGTGKGNSVLDVIKAFEKVTNQKLNYKLVARRPGDVTEYCADTSLANLELGWKAELTIEEALDSAWKWQQKLIAKN